jgi:hypothetical protein
MSLQPPPPRHKSVIKIIILKFELDVADHPRKVAGRHDPMLAMNETERHAFAPAVERVDFEH